MGAAVDHVTPMGMSGGSAEGNEERRAVLFLQKQADSACGG